MFVFYSTHFQDNTGILLDEEHHHCVHVLRHKKGDSIYITNGKGYLFTAIITEINKQSLSFIINSETYHEAPAIVNCIALSYPKSAERLEWFVEKAVEIGISHFVFFKSKRGERTNVNIKRIDKIVISALKQSKQYHLPKIDFTNSLADTLVLLKDYPKKFVAHCQPVENHLINQIVSKECHAILIGPEGDFTNEEILEAKAADFKEVNLGMNILRTETAALLCAVLFESKVFEKF